MFALREGLGFSEFPQPESSGVAFSKAFISLKQRLGLILINALVVIDGPTPGLSAIRK